jgi:WD40 repeat protein
MRTTLGSFLLTACLIATAPAAAPPPQPVDAYGDPLPHAAKARLGTVRWRTGGAARHLAYSPDGKFIAAADGVYQRVQLFDSTTGKLLRTLWGHRESVMSVAFSHDGKRLITSSRDKTARIWDVATGEQLNRFVMPEAARQATFVAAGKEVMILDDSWQVIRLDAGGKELGRTKLGARSWPALSPSGHVAFLRDEAKLCVNGADGKQVFAIDCGRFTTSPVLSPDGKRVAITMGRPAFLKVWDTTNGKEIMSLGADKVGYGGPLCFSNDGKAVLAQPSIDKLRKLDVETGKVVDFAGPYVTGHGVTFSPDGKRVAVASGGALRLYDSAKGTSLNADEQGEGWVNAVAFSPNGKLLAAAGYDDLVRLWDVESGRLVKSLSTKNNSPQHGLHGVAFSRDGKRVAAVGTNRPSGVWDVASGKALHHLDLRSTGAISVVFSPDGETLFAGGLAGIFRLDLKRGTELPTIGSRWDTFEDLQVTKDGKTLVASRSDGVVLFDAAGGKEVRRFTLPVRDCRLTPDGKRLVGVDWHGKFEIYDVADRKRVRTWQGVFAREVRLSPDEKQVAATTPRLLRVWETESGRQGRPVVSEWAGFGAVAYSPDGKWLAACDGPNVVLYQTRALRHAPAYRLTAQQWRWCWEEMGDRTPGWVEDAPGLLLAAGDAWVPLARAVLTPPPVDAKRTAKLIETAAGEDKDAAAKAVAELAKLGAGVRALIDKAIAAEQDAEARLRLFVVRRHVPGPDEEEEAARAPRLVAVLRQLDTPLARALLADMAGGKFGNPWRDAARKK